MRIRFTLAVVFVVALTAPASAQFHASPGFSNTSFPAATVGAFVGGLAPLPSGNLAVFDGTSVVELDPHNGGAVVGALYTPPTPVFGSFLATDPSGAFVLFGESSLGKITRIPLNGAPTTTLATVAFNYDGALDGAGNVYVAHGSTTFAATHLVRIDLATGALTLVATVPGPSGPVAFDSFGNLLYGENSPSFPAPVGSGKIYAFSPSQLANVGAQPTLTEQDAMSIATGLNAISDLIVDAEGDLVVADSINGTIEMYRPDGSFKASVGVPTAPNAGVTYLAFVDDGAAHPALFDAFQPPAGGTLAAVVSDFATTNDIQLVTPKRAHFETTPANPVPVGAFTLQLVEGPANSLAFLFVAANASAQETVAVVNDVPFFFALLPPTIVALGVVQLDNTGTFTLPTTNPGIGIAVAIQAGFVIPAGDPLGTSDALTMTLQ